MVRMQYTGVAEYNRSTVTRVESTHVKLSAGFCVNCFFYWFVEAMHLSVVQEAFFHILLRHKLDFVGTGGSNILKYGGVLRPSITEQPVCTSPPDRKSSDVTSGIFICFTLVQEISVMCVCV
jgi:hypothetical protein